MDLKPRGLDKIEALLAKGVDIPNPLTLDIGPEVDVARISGDGVRVYPGCRIYGDKTVVSAGVQLGAEGPVTIKNVRMGRDVALKAGYARDAVFLDNASMGSGGHIREGCLLEEEAGTAHCVGLKQTILFPFVTLGSLINFCDCLMAGGTSRKNHSEVGSSYIHFNFTPEGDKTTPSLFGDVPRGVLLNQPPIFLGGQGGAVGPVRVGYGSVIAAGSVVRSDVADGHLVIVGPPPSLQSTIAAPDFRGANRIVAKNLGYLANLCALQMLALAKKERTARLLAMTAKIGDDAGDRAVSLRDTITGVLAGYAAPPDIPPDALETGSMMSTDGFLLRDAEAMSRDAWSALFAFWTSMVKPSFLAFALAPSATDTKNGLFRVLITSVADLPPPAALTEGLSRLQAERDRTMVVATVRVTRVFLRMGGAFLKGRD